MSQPGYYNRLRNYITLEFNGGEEYICFDNREVRGDVEFLPGTESQIFRSSGGVASQLGKIKPIRIRFSVRVDYVSTICKLERLYYWLTRRHKMRILMKGFYGCLQVSPCGCGSEYVNADPTTLVSTVTGPIRGLDSDGIFEGAITDFLTPGDIALGDTIIVNGATIEVTADILADLTNCGVMALPYALPVVMDLEADFAALRQALGQGPRADHSTQITLEETKDLFFPTDAGVVIGVGDVVSDLPSGGGAGDAG